MALSDRVTSAAVTSAAVPAGERPPFTVPAGANVAVRIVKSGVIYGLSVNLTALPFNETGFYPLTTLVPNEDNGLVWTIFQTKPIWAFQIDLIVDNQFFPLERRASNQPPATTFPVIDQVVIQLVQE
jgi:hypothetical protein